MRKFISAVTSAAMAATMVSSLAPAVVNAADATKGFSIQTYSASDSKYAKDGNNVSVSSADIAAGDVVIPCAVYLDEATPSTEAISLQLSVSGPDAKGIKFTMYNDGGEINTEDAYFSSEKEFSVGGSTVSSENPVTFAGTASYGSFVAAGMSVPACKQGLSAANIENYYIGLSWTSLGKEYKWTGSKSTDFPVFVFDVTIPKGTKAGDYTLDFLTYNTSKTGGNNPATMIEVTKTDSFDGRYTKEAGNLKLSGMNIKVGEGSSTVSTSTTTKEGPTQTTSTTTKVTPPVGDKDVDFDFGKWTAKPGDTVEVPVMIDSHGNVVISVDCELAVDSPLELVGISDVSPAFKNAAVTGDPTTKCLNFASMTGQGKGRVPSTTAPAFTLTYKVPENCPSGDYNIGFGSKCDVNEDNSEKLYSVGKLNGVITVDGGPTTTTKQGPSQTTSTTTKVTPPVGDKDVDFDFGEWNAKAGDTVEVPVMIDSHGNIVISVDCELDFDSPLELVGISDVSPAFKNAAVTGDPATKCLNFASMTGQGKGRVPSTTAPAFTLTFKVPSNCPAGDYNIGFGSKCDVNEDNSEKLYSVGKLNGVIHVDNGTTTTTTVTTTTDTTTTVTSTTPPAGKKVPNWGDTNEDGVVKVNDVVILNRFLNSTMDLTDQAKVNADCYNPQDPTGGAVDPTKVDLSIADSDAILQRCVHLIELPVVK
jgi:plastocyanin